MHYVGIDLHKRYVRVSLSVRTTNHGWSGHLFVRAPHSFEKRSVVTRAPVGISA